MKLSFLRPGQRSSVKTSKSELAAAGIPQSAVSPTSVAPSSSSASAVSPKNEVPPLAVGQATTEQPQKSPKNKRFSMVCQRCRCCVSLIKLCGRCFRVERILQPCRHATRDRPTRRHAKARRRATCCAQRSAHAKTIAAPLPCLEDARLMLLLSLSCVLMDKKQGFSSRRRRVHRCSRTCSCLSSSVRSRACGGRQHLGCA